MTTLSAEVSSRCDISVTERGISQGYEDCGRMREVIHEHHGSGRGRIARPDWESRDTTHCHVVVLHDFLSELGVFWRDSRGGLVAYIWTSVSLKSIAEDQERNLI